MNHPKPNPKVFDIAGTEFKAEPKHLLGQQQFYEFNLSRDVLRRMGLALRGAPEPNKEVVKFLEQIISDPNISNRLFSPPYVNYSIFRALTKALLADLPKDFCEKLISDLKGENPQLAMRSAAVISNRYTSFHQFPDYKTFLHCLFKYDGITTSVALVSFESRLKSCSDLETLKAEAKSIQADLAEVAKELRPVVGKIDTNKLRTPAIFESYHLALVDSLDKKELKFIKLLEKDQKNILAKKVLGLSKVPEGRPAQTSLEQERLPEVPEVSTPEPTTPDFLEIARNPNLLEQITPGLRKLCATNFIHALSRKNIPLETQKVLLKHLEIFASWPECDHVENFKKFMEFNNASQKQIGLYYLLQLPEKTLVDVLQTLEMKDRNSGDLKRRLDLDTFKVAASFLKLDPEFNEDRVELKLDKIANRLKLGFQPSVVDNFWQ